MNIIQSNRLLANKLYDDYCNATSGSYAEENIIKKWEELENIIKQDIKYVDDMIKLYIENNPKMLLTPTECYTYGIEMLQKRYDNFEIKKIKR